MKPIRNHNGRLLVGALLFSVLALCAVYAASVHAQAGTVMVALVDEEGNPLANYPADYPTEPSNLSYKYRCGGSWTSSTSFQTDANGQTLVSIGCDNWDEKITVTLNQTSKEQDVGVNSTFQTAKVNANLRSCTGPITNVPGGPVDQGGGYWYHHGDTGPTGTVIFYTFPANIKLRMSYNHNSQTVYPTIVAGSNEVDFLTTKLTINYAGDIRSNKGGSWWMFNKPSMDLLPGDYPFYFKTGSTWDGPVAISVSGCSLTWPSEPDMDGDSVPDADDNCPETPNPGLADSDDDGAGDACDGCPDDQNKTDPGICGCGTPDTDTDGDGAADCVDSCPTDSNKTESGICGCGVADTDSDDDGTSDCDDGCPDDPAKTEPGVCGCGVADADTDGDGVADCADSCTDTDGDGFRNPGFLDNTCPADHCPTTPGIYAGCPVGDANYVMLHIVDQQKPKMACPDGKGSCMEPIEGAEVRVFDRNDPDFQAKYGTKNPSGGLYDQVFEHDTGRVGACTSDANGFCLAGEETMGDYLVIVKYVDTDLGTVYTGKPKSPGDFVDGLATKDFQVIKVYKKDRSPQLSGGSKTVLAGSYLEIISPDYAVWEEGVTDYVYPFIFTSDSDWDVDLCAEVPQGYDIVGVYDADGNLISTDECVQTLIANETMVVAYEVVDLQSPKPHMKTKLKIKHKGRVHKFDLETPGHRKGKDKPDKGQGGGNNHPADVLPAAGVMGPVLLAGVWAAGQTRHRRRKRS
jgi:hypothetical protein